MPTNTLERKSKIASHFDENSKKPENPEQNTSKKNLLSDVIDSVTKTVNTAILSKNPTAAKKEVENIVDTPSPMIERPELSSDTSYMVNSQEYFYLHDNHLQKDIEAVLGKGKKSTWTVYFCLYQVNDMCDDPFLEYVLEKNLNARYHFPKITLDTTDKEESTLETLFETQCEKAFSEQIPQDSLEILRTCYRGFLELEESAEKDVLFVFYDLTTIDFTRKEGQCWAIMDEIMNERRVLDIEIELDVFTLFYKFPFLISILNKAGDRVALPLCLYLCEKVEKDETLGMHDFEYRNVVHLSNEASKTQSLLRTIVEHDIFGDVFIFSTRPIVPNPLIKRFAVFAIDPLYIFNKTTSLRKIPSIKLEEVSDTKSHDSSSNPTDEYTCIYFYENNTQLWCIKNSQQMTEIS
jgi:hypothetical protein